ncbi:MAG: hypothetical protein AAFO04_12050 [Cyanobacteria bacterium J06592_8]
MNDIEWSSAEKELARQAFEKAYQREIAALMKVVREQAGQISRLDDIWLLHDFLSARRHDIDGKYDNRESVLMFTFARLVKEGWLHLDELKGLETEKITKVSVLTRM